MTEKQNPGFEHLPPGSSRYIDHPAHAPIGIHPFPDRLYVVTMLENPLRWRARYANYHRFEAMVAASGAILYTCEIAYGDRPFEVTSPENPRHLQLRTPDEIWHKENALNLTMARLPASWNKVAWIDADVQFARGDWAQETLQLLEHYDFIQMFSHAQDLTFDYAPGNVSDGFVSSWLARQPAPHDREFGANRFPDSGYSYGGGKKWAHPGFAWAARRSALDAVGMLIDWAILGSGDWHMACALIGHVERSLNPAYTETYKQLCREWQARAERSIRRNIGFMPGLVNHFFHGSKKNRAYDTRARFLVEAAFDPGRDIFRDSQGLWRLRPENVKLRDGIRAYNRMRDEDARQ